MLILRSDVIVDMIKRIQSERAAKDQVESDVNADRYDIGWNYGYDDACNDILEEIDAIETEEECTNDDAR